MKKSYKLRLFTILTILCGIFVSIMYTKEYITTILQNEILHALAAETPLPEGNVIASGEDGVPWKLYENGYLLFKPEVGKDTLTNNQGETSWKINHGSKIKYVGFSDKVYAPEDSSYLFSSSTKKRGQAEFEPTYIDASKIDTNKVIDMSYMFYISDHLVTIDVRNWDTSKVTNMSNMFSFMYRLKSLDITHFNTSKVTNMDSMFSQTSQLTNLDVTKFDTRNVTDMSNMFSGMINLTNLDVTNFDTRNVTDMSKMFVGLVRITNLDVTKFDTSNVVDMNAMFSNMPQLTNLDVTHFDTSKVTNMYAMFGNLSKLTHLDVTKFDTRNVANMRAMFAGMSNLTNLDVTHFNTSNVTDMRNMFESMSNLTSLDLMNFDTSNMTKIRSIFRNTTKLKELKLGDKFKADGIRTISSNHDYSDQYTDKWHKINDKDHPYTVEDWANLYNSNPTTTAGTWVREEKVQDATLAFDNESFAPITVKPSDATLPTLPRPSQSKQNHKFVGWSRSQDQSIITRESIQPGENITLYPVWRPVENTTSRTEAIPVTTTYRGDDNSDSGTRQETPGAQGMKRITTTYTVTPYTGELTDPVETATILTDMTPTVVTIGTKPKVEMIQRENSDPIRRVTKYTVNPDTGDITETYINELPATGTLGTTISVISAMTLIVLSVLLKRIKKTR